VLLVPWLALLALAPARWFPSPAVRFGWIGYDALLFAGLVALAARWRRSLALALAAAAAADATLGAVQLVAHSLARARGLVDALIIVAALGAPVFAAALLFGARNRARLYGPPWPRMVDYVVFKRPSP